MENTEICDCGFSQSDCDSLDDKCCHPADKGEKLGCKLKFEINAKCSPSQGTCCKGEICDFHGNTERCRQESECQLAQRCNGKQAKCPESINKPDGIPCQDATKVIFKQIFL